MSSPPSYVSDFSQNRLGCVPDHVLVVQRGLLAGLLTLNKSNQFVQIDVNFLGNS